MPGPAGPDAARRADTALALALLALFAASALWRPLLPIDETRYASVAWEMWLRGDPLLPMLNGEPYAHKPPLLMWLLHAGWAVGGVGTLWPRLLQALLAAATVAATVALARTLWPRQPALPGLAALLLVACPVFAYHASALMFDMLLALFVVLAWWGLALAATGAPRRGLAWLALGLAGGLLSKGPATWLHVLPLALAAPWWLRRPPRPWAAWAPWARGVAMATAAAALPLLIWALAAASAGGPAYRDELLWRQTAGRMVQAFAHRQPAWYYLAWLPVLALPWWPWRAWWPALRRALRRGDRGTRFALAGVLLPLLGFSLLSGKRFAYLLPELVLLALLAARGLAWRASGPCTARGPGLALAVMGAVALAVAAPMARAAGGWPAVQPWIVAALLAVALGVALAAWPAFADTRSAVRAAAVAGTMAFAALLAGFTLAMREPYELQGTARQLAAFEAEGRPVAIVGRYHGQWSFVGRLRRPLAEIDAAAVGPWLAGHPGGRVLLTLRDAQGVPPGPRVLERWRYRGGWLLLLAAE
ncbi:MAG: ArnT family glycosyltransferase [Betaproteobacteria bacterium]